MTVTWTINPKKRLMVALCTGDVTRPEVETFLDAIIENDALGYRRVFDASTAIETSMTSDDLLALAVRLRSFQDLGRMGPLAVVLPPGRGKRLTRAFGALAVADRPMQVFDQPKKAYRWIAEQRTKYRPKAPPSRVQADRTP